MKIAVLIAIHGPGAALKQALASVHDQSHADWEVFVVEDGPPTEAEGIVRGFGNTAARPVHYESLGEQQGMASTRNRLLTLATGDAIAFLDPQDVWTPRHLANALPVLVGGADIVVSDIRPLEQQKSTRRSADISPPPQLESNPIRTLFTRDAIASISAVVIRREMASTVGRFDPRFGTGEARDFWLRCSLAGARFAATHRATCFCAGPQDDPDTRAALLSESAVEFFEKHRDLAAAPAALRRRLLAASLVAQGRLLRKSDPQRAARCFWRAWSLQPVHVQTLGQYALTSWRSNPPDEKPE